MKVFVDFDDTLFNTRDFIGEFQNVFEKCGVSTQLYQETHRLAYRLDTASSESAYDKELHLSYILQKEPSIDTECLRLHLSDFLKDTSLFVFPDVIGFLNQMKERGAEVCILSFGQSDFQNQKINASGLTSYMREVFVTTEKKHLSIARALALSESKEKQEPIWFFDDRAEYVDDVKSALPQVKTVQVMRLESRYHDQPSALADFSVKSFHDLNLL